MPGGIVSLNRHHHVGRVLAHAFVFGALTLGLYACADNDIAQSEPTAAPDAASDPTEDFVAEAGDFVNINSMTPVNGYFIDNKLGYVDEAIAVAKSETGGTYPVGTIIQLVPQEAMVKRAKGWSPETNDWEFFFLDVTADGTTIATRGAAETVNRFGGNCADCHKLAEPKWDFVCEQTHGCDPLPIGRDVIEGIQKADPRPLPS